MKAVLHVRAHKGAPAVSGVQLVGSAVLHVMWAVSALEQGEPLRAAPDGFTTAQGALYLL